MRARRSEALDVLRTWLVDRAPLRCELRFADFVATLKVRLTDVSDTQIALLSDDSRSALVLPLRKDFSFGYGDTRLCQTETSEFVRMLVLFFPNRNGATAADAVVFAETKD
jgi:hypothetical protein